MGKPGEQQLPEANPFEVMPEVLCSIPEKSLCHYTSATGLIGILESKQLYATDVRFLNDSQELLYAVDLAKQYLTNQPLQSKDDERKAFADFALKLLDTKDNLVVILGTPTFVASFSEENDLLSQWRGYCPNGNGFAISFSPDCIMELAKAHRWQLLKCLYSKREQDEFLTQLEQIAMTTPIPFPKELGPNPSDKPGLSALSFTVFLTKYGLALKHPTFEEESEWRAFRRVNPTATAISIRESKSSLIPYIGFPLTLNEHEIV